MLRTTTRFAAETGSPSTGSSLKVPPNDAEASVIDSAAIESATTIPLPSTRAKTV